MMWIRELSPGWLSTTQMERSVHDRAGVPGGGCFPLQ
jgi:hypothetical protein